MARIRYLKPEFFFDEKLAELKYEYRLGFQGLWVHADREGRLEDSVKRLKALIFPYDRVDFEQCICELHDKGFIYRYSVNDRKYIQIKNFSKHQRPHRTEKKSEIPLFNSSLTVKDTLKDGEKPDGMGNGEWGMGKGMGMDRTNVRCPPAPPSASPDGPFLMFWNAYPRKEGKGKCQDWFKRNKPSKELLTKILEAINTQKQSTKWTKDGGQFIPMPFTWLNQKRWEDDVQAKPFEGYKP